MKHKCGWTQWKRERVCVFAYLCCMLGRGKQKKNTSIRLTQSVELIWTLSWTDSATYTHIKMSCLIVNAYIIEKYAKKMSCMSCTRRFDVASELEELLKSIESECERRVIANRKWANGKTTTIMYGERETHRPGFDDDVSLSIHTNYMRMLATYSDDAHVRSTTSLYNGSFIALIQIHPLIQYNKLEQVFQAWFVILYYFIV